jgi:hypothetical protein
MSTHDTDEIRARAQERMEELCAYLLPGGKKERHRWLCGSAHGEPGRSFSVNLRTGVFGDWATGDEMRQGAISLWMECRGVDFLTAKRELASWLGTPVHERQPVPAPVHEVQHAIGGGSRRPVCNWLRYVAAMTPERQSEFAQWRGLSPEYVEGLTRAKLIGAIKNGFALPVLRDDREIVSAHCRITTEEGKALWYYAPALSEIGMYVTPFVLGQWFKAQRVHACESPWDAMAIHERLRLYREPLTSVIATRGAGNARLVQDYLFNAREVVLWPQNDEPGQQWMHVARSVAGSCRVLLAKTPADHGDVGEWVKAGATADDLRRATTESRYRSFMHVPAFVVEQFQMAMAREEPAVQQSTFPA